MKIKKLAVTMAIVPPGAATALIAAGTAPYSYGNGSSIYGTGTAAVNPSAPRNEGANVRPSHPHSRAQAMEHLWTLHHKLRRIPQNSTHSLSSSYYKMSYPLEHSRPDRTFSPPTTATSTDWFGSKGKASHRKRTSNAQGGSVAQPGKVLSKKDRQKRTQSATQPEPVKSFEEQRAEDLSFRRLYENLRSWKMLQAVNASFRDNLAPETAAATVHEMQSGVPLYPARHLIILIISFLIVFGLGWSAITYLITITSVSAQCTTSTVYSTVTIPVPVTYTYTYTESIFVSPTACTATSADVDPAATMSDSLTVMPTSTSTFTSFSTTTLTVLSATPSESLVSPSSTLPYIFTVSSGFTVWLNSVSPSSGASLTTATTIKWVMPSESSNSLHTSKTTMQTTDTHTTTITPSAETSTSTTFINPDLTLTTHITRTSTVTPTTTMTRSSFGGLGSSGWNMTSSQNAGDVGSMTAAAAQGTATTATISYFWASSGGQTYSTSTQFITTTLYHTYVSGLMPTLPSPSMSQTSRNSTGPLTGLPSSMATDFEGSSSFPTMNPGTDGINPASSSATGSSGLALTSPESVTSPAVGMTGLGTGVTLTASSASSALNATVSDADVSPESATGVSTKPGPSESSATPSSVNSSTLSSQNASSIVSATFTASTSSLDAKTTVPSRTGASEADAAATSTSSLESNTSTGVTTDASSNSTLSPVAVSTTGSMTASSSSMAFNASLTSVIPSTQALTSIGSSLANGPATPTSSDISSITQSSQATSPTGSFSATSQASSPSPSVLSTSSSGSTTTTSSKTSASASASPTACGEHGDFTLDFDDLPAFSGDEDITQAPPIFSPYHHLTFSSGYVHAAQPKQPFAPHSGDQLAVFLAPSSGTNDTVAWHQPGMSASIPRTEPGEITDGPYDGLPAFWFNAKGAWLGCDNDGPESCVFNVTGLTWDSQLGDDVDTYNTQIEVPPCPGFDNCQLQHVDFPKSFRGLSGIQIQAFANGKPRMFFMDDLALSWFDNTCEAGMQRMGRPGSFGGPGRSGGGGGRKRVVRRSLMR